jgi:hypothetical protein
VTACLSVCWLTGWQLAVSLTLPLKETDQIKAQGCWMIGKGGLEREREGAGRHWQGGALGGTGTEKVRLQAPILPLDCPSVLPVGVDDINPSIRPVCGESMRTV